MRLRKPQLGAVILLISFGVVVQAAPDDPVPAGTEASGSGAVVVGGSVTVKLTPQEMSAKSAQLLAEMESSQTRLVELQLSSRTAKDVIKLNCVNDKLLQVKQLLNIADEARLNLDAGGDDRDFAFSQITLSSEKIAGLRSEAEACAGENDIYVGATKVMVTSPRIIDDPTTVDPFTITSIEIERPTYATPYL